MVQSWSCHVYTHLQNLSFAADDFPHEENISVNEEIVEAKRYLKCRSPLPNCPKQLSRIPRSTSAQDTPPR